MSEDSHGRMLAGLMCSVEGPKCKVCSVHLQVKELVKSAYTRARHILTQHERDLHTLAKELLDKETLSGEQIKKLLKIAVAPSQQASIASS